MGWAVTREHSSTTHARSSTTHARSSTPQYISTCSLDRDVRATAFQGITECGSPASRRPEACPTAAGRRYGACTPRPPQAQPPRERRRPVRRPSDDTGQRALLGDVGRDASHATAWPIAEKLLATVCRDRLLITQLADDTTA